MTCHRPPTTHPSPPPTLGKERGGRMDASDGWSRAFLLRKPVVPPDTLGVSAFFRATTFSLSSPVLCRCVRGAFLASFPAASERAASRSCHAARRRDETLAELGAAVSLAAERAVRRPLQVSDVPADQLLRPQAHGRARPVLPGGAPVGVSLLQRAHRRAARRTVGGAAHAPALRVRHRRGAHAHHRDQAAARAALGARRHPA